MRNKVFEAAENAVRSFGANVAQEPESESAARLAELFKDFVTEYEQLVRRMQDGLLQIKDRAEIRLKELSGIIPNQGQSPVVEIPMEREDSKPGELQYHLSFRRGQFIDVYDPVSDGYKCGTITRTAYFKPESQWSKTRGTWMIDVMWCCSSVEATVEACRVLHDGDRFPETEDDD